MHYEPCHCRTNTPGSLQQRHASPQEIWVWLAGETMLSRACCGCCGWWNGRLGEALWGVHWWRAANRDDLLGRRSVFLSGCFRGVSHGGMRSWTQLEGVGWLIEWRFSVWSWASLRWNSMFFLSVVVCINW